ncbi:MAG TPA: hypothetical protein VNS60_00365 [Solirubrobacterales bacterium]|nr:hypothetical protein [Solirubrobacterales bacterium]
MPTDATRSPALDEVQDSTPGGYPAPEAPPEVIDPANERQRLELLEFFHPLFSGTGGIDSWLHDGVPQTVIARLNSVNEEPLTREQLNQLLVLSHEAGLGTGFFKYYWLEAPAHTYEVRALADFDEMFLGRTAVESLQQLRWGLQRFFIDALLFFGNVRSAYRRLRDMDFDSIESLFNEYRFETSNLLTRGASLPLHAIPRDDRYLISEMACKSLGKEAANLGDVLRCAYEARVTAGNTSSVSPRQLLEEAPTENRKQLTFTADELLDDELTSIQELESKVAELTAKFDRARSAALQNTKLYLSMVEDLDVYVATSMRSRNDFREMAKFCDEVFEDDRLRPLDIRYFDPTLSAAEGHEDKGLIECLMVKSAKALIYFAGTQESYGKDAEAAMALSQGKPVILYCPDPDKRQFYRDVHPLARLIDFRNGVANGWMVASTPGQVSELLARVLGNEMEYKLEQTKPGHLRLKESLTGSVVRLQTSDKFLRETFWNYYQRPEETTAGVAG